MNLCLIFEDDVKTGNAVELTGRRAEHIRSVLRADAGQRIKVGILNGAIGSAVVSQINSTAVTIQIDFPLLDTPPPTLPLTLILALPRPKMLQRTLQTIATMGVQRLCLIHSMRVEKSYWQSPLLEKQKIAEHLILGLEQAVATQMPEIEQHPHFDSFMQERLPELDKGARKFVAHPGDFASATPQTNAEVLLAIGPEGGFVANEIKKFVDAGFEPIQLGARILRVETAIPVTIAKLFE